jgi:hypothetical protein
MDSATGRLKWTRLHPSNQDLFFATPRFVILKTGLHAAYEFIDSDTGEDRGSMKPDYFNTVFCPHADTLAQLDAFQRSNCRIPLPELYGELLEPAWSAYIKLGGNEFHKELVTKEMELTDPFGWDSFLIKASNNWRYVISYSSSKESSQGSLDCTSWFERWEKLV